MKLHRIAVTLATALVYALAMPNELLPEGSLLLGLLALAGYFAALGAADSFREARRIGIVFGSVSTVLSNYWLMFFGDFSVWTIGGVTLGYAVYHSLLGPIIRRAWQNPLAWRSLAVGAIWAAYEYLKSIGFLAYPWGLISYPAAGNLVLIQHVDITGVWALSFLFAALNALIAELMIPALRSHAAPPGSIRARLSLLAPQFAWCAVILAVMLGYGTVRLRTDIPRVADIRMVLVQQNVNAWARGAEADALRAAQRLTLDALATAAVPDASDQAPSSPPPPVDLVVWSETSLRRSYAENLQFYASTPPEHPFRDFVRELGAPLLTGAPYIADYDSWDIYNAAIMLDQSAEMVQYYGKQHLVPFAESIPFWDIDRVRHFFQDMVGLYGVWTVAPDYRLFELHLGAADADDAADPDAAAAGAAAGAERTEANVSSVRFGTPICFEDAFAYLVRGFVNSGADLLVNLTDNSWSATNSAQYQHFVAARFRPVETRRTLVRSTNSGLTSVIDAHGRVIAELPMFTAATLMVDVPVYREARLTVYTVWGDYLPQAFLLFWLLLVVLQAMRDGRGKSAHDAAFVPLRCKYR